MRSGGVETSQYNCSSVIDVGVEGSVVDMYYLLLYLLLCVVCVVYSSNNCVDGYVPDLDGACVEKVVITTQRAKCPTPDIDNGQVFFLVTGRIVQFYCNTGYVRVPDTATAICQVQGTWSKVVPVCLKPGCQVIIQHPDIVYYFLQVPPAPSYGSMTTSYNNTLAVFTCSPSYSLSGSAILACSDGNNWNSSVPVCVDNNHNITIDGATSNHIIYHLLISTIMMSLIL